MGAGQLYLRRWQHQYGSNRLGFRHAFLGTHQVRATRRCFVIPAPRTSKMLITATGQPLSERIVVQVHDVAMRRCDRGALPTELKIFQTLLLHKTLALQQLT